MGESGEALSPGQLGAQAEAPLQLIDLGRGTARPHQPVQPLPTELSVHTEARLGREPLLTRRSLPAHFSWGQPCSGPPFPGYK